MCLLFTPTLIGRSSDDRRATARLWDAAESFRRSGRAEKERCILAQIAATLANQQDYVAILKVLARQLELAKSAGDLSLASHLLSQMGDAYVFSKDSVGLGEPAVRFLKAETFYRESADLAAQTGDSASQTKMLLNASVAARKRADNPAAIALLDRAQRAAQQIREIHDRLTLQVVVAYGWSPLGDRDRAMRSLNSVVAAAQAAGDTRVLAAAYGYLGAVDEQGGDWPAALEHTRKALFQAQQLETETALSGWQRQLGQIHSAMGHANEAIQAYRLAVSGTSPAKSRIAFGFDADSDPAQPNVSDVYLEFADLLLQRSHRETGAPRQVDLKEARDVLLSRRESELMDFFGDDCAKRAPSHPVALDAASPDAVVIYPVFFADRVEVIFSKAGALDSYTLTRTPGEVRADAALLRRFLEKRTTLEYEAPARKLFEVLIKPLEEKIGRKAVSTLVFVPDGPLHGIPIAALYDGSEFLVERYAIATASGLRLHDSKALARRPGLLAAGLSDSKGPYPELPFVRLELDSASEQFHFKKELLNNKFEIARLDSQYRRHDFGVVHIASHAEFHATAGSSVIITHGRDLGVGELDRLLNRDNKAEPLELLVLSACETAAGDDRAALGLGGIAVQAGAKSALGTLWHINDKATSQLFGAFYEKLFDPRYTKAGALQFAQQKLLHDTWFRHPGYWAPFLLINDWR
jgi:CHAT domain-containing protein